MSANMQAALAHLNSATERQYTITQADAQFSLVMPNGGLYPPCGAQAMMQRLVTLTHAAQGRTR